MLSPTERSPIIRASKPSIPSPLSKHHGSAGKNTVHMHQSTVPTITSTALIITRPDTLQESSSQTSKGRITKSRKLRQKEERDPGFHRQKKPRNQHPVPEFSMRCHPSRQINHAYVPPQGWKMESKNSRLSAVKCMALFTDTHASGDETGPGVRRQLAPGLYGWVGER